MIFIIHKNYCLSSKKCKDFYFMNFFSQSNKSVMTNDTNWNSLNYASILLFCSFFIEKKELLSLLKLWIFFFFFIHITQIKNSFPRFFSRMKSFNTMFFRLNSPTRSEEIFLTDRVGLNICRTFWFELHFCLQERFMHFATDIN